jgi:hypothetical protein
MEKSNHRVAEATKSARGAMMKEEGWKADAAS